MKIITLACRLATIMAALHLVARTAHAAGIPEPGLVMYGAVRNTAAANARLTTGTLTWTITPASGAPVTLTTPLTDISGQYSYALRVPFESVVGSSTLSANTLPVNSANTSYIRTNVFLTVNGTNYPAAIVSPAIGNFTFNTSIRGKMDPVDLTFSAPGVTSALVTPAFASTQRAVNGHFQMSISGSVGQSYTLMASTDLITWSNVTVFVCTNSQMEVCDPGATNFPKRFYKLH